MAATTRQKSGWITANIVVILLVLIPVVWIASLSFKDPSTITDPTFFPTKWTWANYSGIFNSSEFTRPLLNSIGIGLIATQMKMRMEIADPMPRFSARNRLSYPRIDTEYVPFPPWVRM